MSFALNPEHASWTPETRHKSRGETAPSDNVSKEVSDVCSTRHKMHRTRAWKMGGKEDGEGGKGQRRTRVWVGLDEAGSGCLLRHDDSSQVAAPPIITGPAFFPTVVLLPLGPLLCCAETATAKAERRSLWRRLLEGGSLRETN